MLVPWWGVAPNAFHIFSLSFSIDNMAHQLPPRLGPSSQPAQDPIFHVSRHGTRPVATGEEAGWAGSLPIGFQLHPLPAP